MTLCVHFPVLTTEQQLLETSDSSANLLRHPLLLPPPGNITPQVVNFTGSQLENSISPKQVLHPTGAHHNNNSSSSSNISEA